MIVSASRRTDIPRFYLDWFVNRLRDGFVLVRNPMNFHQVSKVFLSPDVVDCIVFWSKNPEPLLHAHTELERFPYYVQFTLNPYGADFECALPEKQKLVETFHRLSERIGAERVVWRYSPILLNNTYSPETHLSFFADHARLLSGFTKRCHISILDWYAKIKKRMHALGVWEDTQEQVITIAQAFVRIGAQYGIQVSACGSPALTEAGIPQATCIDASLVSSITGKPYQLKKDTGQRPVCNCAASIDIGTYDTCANGCAYCYANASESAVRSHITQHDPYSPMLCGTLTAKDKVTLRKL